jgi:hypothetical protein
MAPLCPPRSRRQSRRPDRSPCDGRATIPAPIPMPTGLVVKNGLQMRAMFAFEMPVPVSPTSMAACPRATTFVMILISFRLARSSGHGSRGVHEEIQYDLAEPGLVRVHLRHVAVFFDDLGAVSDLVPCHSNRRFDDGLDVHRASLFVMRAREQLHVADDPSNAFDGFARIADRPVDFPKAPFELARCALVITSLSAVRIERERRERSVPVDRSRSRGWP